MKFSNRIQNAFYWAIVCFLGSSAPMISAAGPIRVLFLGHESEHHNANRYFPMLQQALGPEAIYFDYVTDVESALGDGEKLGRFDAFLLYANHGRIESHQWENLLQFVEGGKGFLPIHCASWCFSNEPGFDQLVGGRFESHQTGIFVPRTLRSDHPAIRDVPELEAWDETYYHVNHNPSGRTVLQVRDVMKGDPHTDPEPWTWIREQGKGRVFYTASGHDHRVWNRSEFHDLIRKGILWAVGDQRRLSYEAFLAARPPLRYETRGDIPNYERRSAPLPYQLPLLPEESMLYTRVPMGFELELFASEPDIVNPIAMTWDEGGRLYVAETVDYPNEIKDGRKGNDRIKLLEDTDGDGRCDKVTIYAEGLNIPTSLVAVEGGLIVAHAPEFLFFKDLDGDDRADVRQVINRGWGVRDTHAGPSNLRYGFDNRIWGTVGYSGYQGERNGESYRFGSGVFQMEADGTSVTFLHQFNNNTWGLGFNSRGEVFGSTANNNPSFFCGFPATGYRGASGMSAAMIAKVPDFHPITPNVRQVDAFGRYTAGAGHALATSGGFPEAWRDSMAFVAGPTGHLLGGYLMEPDGSGFSAKNAYSLVASVDEWFSPVAAEVGPDGALWIADWYNFIIQHNPTPQVERGGYAAKNGPGNAHINPNRDRLHGRIYRLVWEDSERTAISSLREAGPRALVRALDDENLFWRLTAQRLLVERNDEAVAKRLQDRVLLGDRASVHALWALQGMGQLSAPLHQAALLSESASLRQNAIRALGNDDSSARQFFDSTVVTDPDLNVRREAVVKMAHLTESETLRRAVSRLFLDAENRDDPWISLGLKSIASRLEIEIGGRGYGPNLIKNPSAEAEGEGTPGWKTRIYGGDRNTQFEIVQKSSSHAMVRTGNQALKIESAHGADAGWSTEVVVKPNTEYRLSGWIKTEGIKGAKGAMFNVHSVSDAVTQALQKKNDWTLVQVEFNSGGRSAITINCLYGGWGRSTGTAYYDDVALQEIVYQPVAAVSDAPVGDAGRGEIIFREHPVASCIRCHQVGGEGGVVGPYLDGIAARKQSDYLRESLLSPQAKMAEGFTAAVSPMPPFGVLLTPQEIEDLLAFLETLTEEPDPTTLKPVVPASFE